MKSLTKLFCVSLLILVGPAFAGNQTSVAISSVQAGQSITGGTGPFLIQFGQNASSSPACVGSSNKAYYAVDPTTTYGQAVISTVMMAFALGKTVTAYGAGTCNILSNYEDLAYLYTTD